MGISFWAVMYVVQTFMAAMDLPMTYARLLFVLSCLPIVMGVWWITTRATTGRHARDANPSDHTVDIRRLVLVDRNKGGSR